MGIMGRPPPPEDAHMLPVLQQAYQIFTDAHNQDPEIGRARLNELLNEVQSKGLHGPNSLRALGAHRRSINWEAMSLDAFSTFYRFVFFLCREAGKRNMQVEVALSAWPLIMRGRFRLLDKWCVFVRNSDLCIITEDTWRQVLGFSRTVHEDLCGYDPSGAWPVLLDEFVDSLRSQGASCRAAAGGAGMMADAAGAERVHAHAPLPAGLAQLGLACVGTLRLGPVSPHSGSKRRAVEDCVVEEVADQLQHMPLVSVAEQDAMESGDIMRTGPDANNGRLVLTAKRHCTTPPPSSRTVCDGSPMVACSSSPACSGALASGCQPCAVSLFGSGGGGGGSSFFPPAAQLCPAMHLPPTSPSLLFPTTHGAQPLSHMGMSAAHAHAHMRAPAGAADTMGMHCTQSVNALMEATVTEALGLG